VGIPLSGPLILAFVYSFAEEREGMRIIEHAQFPQGNLLDVRRSLIEEWISSS
jgi:hypothetical protein